MDQFPVKKTITCLKNPDLKLEILVDSTLLVMTNKNMKVFVGIPHSIPQSHLPSQPLMLLFSTMNEKRNYRHCSI